MIPTRPYDLISQQTGLTRAQFLARLLGVLGDTRLLWMPRPYNTTTATTEENTTGRTITWDATVASRLAQLGRGTSQSFTSGSSQYGTTPDTNDLSFGNGTTDSSFSVILLVNVTDTAANRDLITKNGAGAAEWTVRINTADKLAVFLADQSAGVFPSRISDSAIPQGAWHLFGATYDVTAGSGATAATAGMKLYQDGAVLASTGTDNAAYVAMENLTTPVEIGSDTAHTANFFDGALALVAVCQKALSAADHAAIAGLCRQFFGAP